jgi:hypothetical protein
MNTVQKQKKKTVMIFARLQTPKEKKLVEM